MTTLKIGQTVKSIIAAINGNFTELSKKPNLQYKVLWSGSKDIPAKLTGNTTTITLSDSLANYKGLILQLENCNAWTYFGSLAAGTILGPINQESGNTQGMEGWNVFGYKCEIVSNTSLKFSNFIFTGSTLDLNEMLEIYTTRYVDRYSIYPLVKIIGIKFN